MTKAEAETETEAEAEADSDAEADGDDADTGRPKFDQIYDRDQQHVVYHNGQTPQFWNHLDDFEGRIKHYNREGGGEYGNGVRQGQVDHKEESGAPEPVQPECEIDWETARVTCQPSDPTPWQARWK